MYWKVNEEATIVRHAKENPTEGRKLRSSSKHTTHDVNDNEREEPEGEEEFCLGDDDVKLAACWVEDAAAGRMVSGSASMIGKPHWQRLAFQLNTAVAWEHSLAAGSILLLILTAYEPASSFDVTCFGPGISRLLRK